MIHKRITFRREQRKKHIARRKRTIDSLNAGWLYKFEGMLGKGKLRRTCRLTREPVRGSSAADRRRLGAVNYSLGAAYPNGRRAA